MDDESYEIYQCENACGGCLNRGVCNEATGICACAPGFAGNRCDTRPARASCVPVNDTAVRQLVLTGHNCNAAVGTYKKKPKKYKTKQNKKKRKQASFKVEPK